MTDEFYSFDEALDELRLKEEELKRLVSEGEIRAFRKGDTMKLRRSDVENLRAELSGGEVVDLGDVTEELVFEDDADLGDEAGMATQEIADVETIIDHGVEDVGELELEDDVSEARPMRRAAYAGGTMAATSVVADEEEPLGAGLLFAMIGTTALMIIAMPLLLSISSGDLSDMAKSIAGLFGKSFE